MTPSPDAIVLPEREDRPQPTIHPSFGYFFENELTELTKDRHSAGRWSEHDAGWTLYEGGFVLWRVFYKTEEELQAAYVKWLENFTPGE